MATDTNGAVDEPKTWTEFVLEVLRFLAAVNGSIALLLAIYHLSSHAEIKPLSVSMPFLIRAELVFQAFTILCLIGYVLQSLPGRRTDDWVREDNSVTRKVFAGISVADRQQHLKNVWDSARQFSGCWVGLWLVWFALYITWAVNPPPLSKAVTSATILGDSFHMLSMSAVFLCYFVLARRTTPSQAFQFPQKIFLIVVPLLALGLSGIFFTDKQSIEPLHWLEGLVSAVGIALLVARLDSGLLKTKPYVIAALFGYAAIQFSYGKLAEEDWLFLVVTSLALVFKVLLFREIWRITHSGTLFWYLFEFRKMYEATADDDIVIIAKNEFLHAIGMRRPTNVIPFGKPRNPLVD